MNKFEQRANHYAFTLADEMRVPGCRPTEDVHAALRCIRRRDAIGDFILAHFAFDVLLRRKLKDIPADRLREVLLDLGCGGKLDQTP